MNKLILALGLMTLAGSAMAAGKPCEAWFAQSGRNTIFKSVIALLTQVGRLVPTRNVARCPRRGS